MEFIVKEPEKYKLTLERNDLKVECELTKEGYDKVWNILCPPKS